MKHRLVAIVKATGLGITELYLLWTEWMCLSNNHEVEMHNSQVGILVGQSIKKAMELIRRMRDHLDYYNEGTAYAFDLPNGIHIEAYPSMNISAARSLPNPKIWIVDEAGFFGMKNDEEARTVVDRYITKSNPYIAIFSTPNLPDGMFYRLMHEEECLYKRIYLPYTVGTNKIYSEKQLAISKQTPSFEREYNLQWGFGSGDIFSISALEAVSRQSYELHLHEGSDSILALDPAYGSSKFGILGLEMIDGKYRTILCEELERVSDSDALSRIHSILDVYGFSTLYIDSAYPNLVEEFKDRVNTEARNFRTEGHVMIDNAAKMVSTLEVQIHPQHEELLRQLRSARRNAKGQLDKKGASLDLVDCFDMACYHKIRGGGEILDVDD